MEMHESRAAPTNGAVRETGWALLCAILAGMLATSTTTAQAQQTAPQQQPDCAKYDSIRPRGTTTPWPSTCATLSPELGGYREKLYEHGWNLRGYVWYSALYDIGGRNSRKYQTYNGQKPLQNGLIWFSFLYDLSRLGLNQGATFTFDVNTAASTWEYYTPTKTYINELSVYTPFADDRADLKFGYVRAEREFYGAVSGTSLGASALRAESAINIQAGMSVMEPSPYLGVTVYDKEHRFYGKAAVSQSMSPNGLFANSEAKDNLFSDVPGAKELYVGEVGFRGRPDLGDRAHWFRAGAIYNTSQYAVFDSAGGTAQNYAFYSQADIQLTQTAAGVPQLGWYLNLRANYAPPDRNLYTGDVGLSLYKIGTFPSRPMDLFSVGVARNWFSRDARRLSALGGVQTASYQTTLSASYAYAVTPGLYVNAGLSHTDNPTFSSAQKAATVASLSVTMGF